MNRTWIPALTLVSVLVVACATAPPMAPKTPFTAVPEASAARRGTMRLDVPADADVADVPWLVAVDSLKEQGYRIEAMSFADSALGAAAMAQGDLDVGCFSNQVAWAATGKGAPILTIMDRSANPQMIISTKDMQTCADLDGRSVAVPSVTAVTAAMLDAYVERNCPEAEPQTVIVSGGSNRTAALLSGAVDAAMQDIDDLIKIEREQPGQFHPLIVFALEFPGLHVQSYMARSGFAEQHPEMLKDVIRALFAARLSLQDPGALREAIIKYVDLEPDKAQQAAEIYLTREFWDLSGSYKLESVQATLDFLQEHATLPPGLKAEDVADLSYYEAVLDEIGR
jgi:NitT/TauT family transport system substrate-binding protein